MSEQPKPKNRLQIVREDWEAARAQGLCLVLIKPTGGELLVESVTSCFAFVTRPGKEWQLTAKQLDKYYNDDSFWGTRTLAEVNQAAPVEAEKVAKTLKPHSYTAASVTE